MGPYMSRAGGYLANPDAATVCQFCSFRTTDEFLDLSIKYSNRWRDVRFLSRLSRSMYVIPHLLGIIFIETLADHIDLSLHVLVAHEAMG